MPKYRVPFFKGAHLRVQNPSSLSSNTVNTALLRASRECRVRPHNLGRIKEKIMKRSVALLALVAALASLPARAAEIDWKKVDAALGKTATVSGDVHRYGLPRTDLHVTLDGLAI